jgi:hypothetical protein
MAGRAPIKERAWVKARLLTAFGGQQPPGRQKNRSAATCRAPGRRHDDAEERHQLTMQIAHQLIWHGRANTTTSVTSFLAGHGSQRGP